MKRIVFFFGLAFLLFAVLFNAIPFVAGSHVIRVPQDYATIQAAINAAVSGDTVLVSNGTYLEHVVVNKTISLNGENKTTTIIDANGTGTAVWVQRANVTVSRFTIQNSGKASLNSGIYLCYYPLQRRASTLDANITGNIIQHDGYGVLVDAKSTNNTIAHNDFIDVSYAVSTGSSNNFIIENNFLQASTGIIGGSNNFVTRNNFINSSNAIYVSGSNNSIVGNMIFNCSNGIYLFGPAASRNYIGDNQIFWNQWGIQLLNIVGTSNVFRNNTMFDNRFNFGWPYDILPSSLPCFIQDIDTSNTVNGKPIYYLVNTRDVVVTGNPGFVAVVNSTNVAMENLNITGNYQNVGMGQISCVICAYTHNSAMRNASTNKFEVIQCSNMTVENNIGPVDFRNSNSSIITNNYGGLSLSSCNNNQIANNTYGYVSLTSSNNNYVLNNFDTSIHLEASNGTIIEGNQGCSIAIWRYQSSGQTWASKNNTVVNNNNTAIMIMGSYNNTVCNNAIATASNDIRLSSTGIVLEGASNNTIKDNMIRGIDLGGGSNSTGMSITFSYGASENNTIIGNTFYNQTIGIMIEYGRHNTFKENALFNNRYNFGGEVFSNDIDTSNTINRKPIYILVDQSNLTIDSSTYPDIGYLALDNCTNVTIRNLILTSNCEGLKLLNTTNVTVIDCTIKENIVGLHVEGSFNNIINNTIRDNLAGLTLYEYGNNTVSGNTIANNTYRNIAPQDPRFDQGFGIPDFLSPLLGYGMSGGCAVWSDNNTITSNIILNNERGISLRGGENTFRNNIIAGNRYNIDFQVGEYRGYLPQLVQDMDSSNLIEGKPVYYWINQRDKQVPEPAGFVVLVNCTNITIKNLNITHNRMGIVLAGTNNTIITNVTITNCLYGIFVRNVPSEYYDPLWPKLLISSFYNTIMNCTLTNNGAGIALYGANLTSALNNNISKNMMGIWIYRSSYNLIKDNTVTNNTIPQWGTPYWPFPEGEAPPPILTWLDWGGIVVEGCFNIVAENTITHNDVGLSVGSPIIGSPGGNLIYHNNFINNTNQLWVGSENFWNLGYPEGGNYFSDYTGMDNYSGINQTELGCDGIGDTPYAVSWSVYSGTSYSGWAYYPLMNPWTPTPTRAFNLNVTNTLYEVVFNTNSAITHLQLNNNDPSHPILAFNAKGLSGTTGYCNITIPKALIKAEPRAWVIRINGTIVDSRITENTNATFISFNYTYHSTLKIEITGTSAVPELPSYLILPLFMLATLLAAFVLKRKRSVRA